MGQARVSESIKRNTVNYECIRLDCKVDWGLSPQIMLCPQQRVVMVVGVVHMAVVGALCGGDGNGGDGNRSERACARADEELEVRGRSGGREKGAQARRRNSTNQRPRC